MQISKIDILVYPAWCGGESERESYGRKYKVVRASCAKRTRWMNYAKQIAKDDSRILIAIDDTNGRLEDYLWNEKDWQGKQLAVVRYALTNFPDRFFMVTDSKVRSNGSKLENQHYLSDLIRPKYDMPDPVMNSAYGHHLDDCVINIGQSCLKSLGLEKTELHQDVQASVADVSQVFLRLIKKYNPKLIERSILKMEPPTHTSPFYVLYNFELDNLKSTITCAIMDSSIIHVAHWMKKSEYFSDIVNSAWEYRLQKKKLHPEKSD